jgi:hypothetical protein
MEQYYKTFLGIWTHSVNALQYIFFKPKQFADKVFINFLKIL